MRLLADADIRGELHKPSAFVKRIVVRPRSGLQKAPYKIVSISVTKFQ